MTDSLISNEVLNIYASIQSHSPEASFFNYLSELFELSNIIIVIDIVFHYKRNFINITFPIYFLSPVFYLEFFLNHFVKKNSINNICKSLEKEDYKNDQIFLIISKYFKDEIYFQNCFYNDKSLRLIILIIILISFVVHLINIDNLFISYVKYFCSIIIYFFLKTINLVVIIIFNREIILQLTDNYDKIDLNYVYGLFYFVFFKIIFLTFMRLFYYSFFQNKTNYLHNQHYLLQEICLQEISSILIILRLNIKFSFVIQTLWLFFVFNFFILKIKDMILTNNTSRLFKYYQMSNIIIMSILFGRMISLFVIKFNKDKKVFKILDFIIIILFLLVFSYFIYGKRYNFTLVTIDTYLKKKNNLFFYGIAQIYEPITRFFLIKYKQGKISGKEKEIVDIYIQYFKQFLFKNSFDFFIIGELKDKLIPLFAGRKTKNPSNTNDDEREKIVFDILTFFIKYFKKKIKDDKSPFERKVNELLNYYKIQLFFIMDDKTFRAQYFLQNFRYSKIFPSSPLIAKCIFKSIRTSLLDLEKKSEDNSMGFIIIFQELNNEYLNILKCFKIIINNLSENQYEIYRIIDIRSLKIKNSLDKIIETNKIADDVYKIRNQSEFDKFQLVEEILFNGNSEKNFDYYDYNALDTVVERNDSFLILFEKNQFIIKKAPLPFFERTKRKTNKLKETNVNYIFPSEISKNQMKLIKSHLLKERHYKIETVFEDNEGYIIGCKLSFSMLPTFKGKIFITCKIENQHDYEIQNYALCEKENLIIKFGIFFKEYFGISSEQTSIHLINLFGIKNYVLDGKDKTYSVNFSKMNKLIKKNYEKYYAGTDMKFEDNLNQFKRILGNEKTFNLEIKVRNKFKNINDDIYLLQFVINDLIKNFKLKKQLSQKFMEAQTEMNNNNNNISIRDTASVASAISTKLHNENAWNITTQSKKKQKSESNVFSTISLGYSVFLIVMAIIICIYTKIYSNGFKNDYLNISIFRQNNIDFVWGQYCLSNIITKKITGDPYDDLFNYYYSVIENFNMSFFEFYLELFQNSTLLFFEYLHQFKEQFGQLSSGNKFYKVLYINFTVYSKNGENQTLTYFESFDEIFSYYYSISQSVSSIVRMPKINFEDIPNNLNKIEEPQKSILSIIYNYHKYISIIYQVNYDGKKYFDSAFKKFRLIIYLIFILFLCANLFGILIILLSINLSTTILNMTTKNIITITHKQVKILLKKLKFAKQLLSNEKKPSIITEEIKKEFHKNKKKKQNNNNNNFLDSPSSDKNLLAVNNHNNQQEENNDDYIPVVDLRKKTKKYYFKIFITSIQNLILSLLLYIILLVVAFPIMKTHFTKIGVQKDLTDYIDDLNISLMNYLIKSKFAILFNSSEGMDNLIYEETHYIYNNYSSFSKKIQNKKTYKNLIEKTGEIGACEEILEGIKTTIYYNSIINICKVENLYIARYSSKLSGFLTKTREIYLSFIDERNNSNMDVYYYSSYSFQTLNLFEYIFYVTFLGNLETNYIKPDLKIMINQLTNFILVIFSIMIVFQIFNYVQGSFIILDKFVRTIEVYDVIGKFFEKKDENQEKKN